MTRIMSQKNFTMNSSVGVRKICYVKSNGNRGTRNMLRITCRQLLEGRGEKALMSMIMDMKKKGIIKVFSNSFFNFIYVIFINITKKRRIDVCYWFR